MGKSSTNRPTGSQTRGVSIKHLEAVNLRTLVEDIGERDQWLVEPLIPARRSTAIVAKGGVGKSLIMLEVCAALATGKPTLGRPAGSPVSVVYVDMEMSLDDLAERLASFGYDPTTDIPLQENLHYYQLQSFKPFDTPLGGKELLAVVKLHQADLVVIDTLARVIKGEENNADTFHAFAANTGKPLKAAHVTVVRLDHEGKTPNRGARGSSAKRDDVDLAWTMSTSAKTPGNYRFERDKSRMGWVPALVILAQAQGTPLRHEIEHGKLTKKAASLVADMDRLGLAPDVGRPTAKKALTEAGIRASTGDLVAAIAARKQRTGQVPGQASWTTNGQRNGTGTTGDG